jgi:hypothetical protein
LKLATVRVGGTESAAVVLPGGVVPLGDIRDLEGWPSALFALLEGCRFYDLRHRWRGLSESALEELLRLAVPFPGASASTTPSTQEICKGAAPSDEPASFKRPDTTVVGEEILLPGHVTFTCGVFSQVGSGNLPQRDGKGSDPSIGRSLCRALLLVL